MVVTVDQGLDKKERVQAVTQSQSGLLSGHSIFVMKQEGRGRGETGKETDEADEETEEAAREGKLENCAGITYQILGGTGI